MVPSGPPPAVGGGSQSVSSSLLRSSSGILGVQGSQVPSQNTFPSLVSPRAQSNNMNFLGNMSNVSSLNQSFGSGVSSSGLSGSANLQRGGVDTGAEPDPLSSVGNGMGFVPSPASYAPSNTTKPNISGQGHGHQFHNRSGNQQSQQLEPQKFQRQQSLPNFPVPNSQQQQPCQSTRGGLGNVTVKLESQMTNGQNRQQKQLQSLRNLGQVKLEQQQIQTFGGLNPVKLEPQHSDQTLFLQQQQQQKFLHMSRPSSQTAAAHMNILQQQHLLQLQQQQHQQQQQQLLKSLPQQRPQLQQQFQQQNLPTRTAVKPPYEPGLCARRLTHYMYHQQHRPADNNIDFWRKFVAEYFAPHAKKRWCVSMYESGRQTTGVFPQDVWHCEICHRKPGRGFETTAEVLPRLCKIKYDSGTLEELLYIDMPREYQNVSGQIVLDYAKAIQESVFEQLRVVRDGQLRIVFSQDLKIVSWEFCARHHEELIPRRLMISQVSQLGQVAQKHQAATQNGSSNLSAQNLHNNCNMFVSSARQLAKALEVPLVNDLGYTKRYVRCLQISEVVNSMKDLIDYSRERGTGPMASLINFPRRTSTTSGVQNQGQQSEDQQQQIMAHNSNNDQSSTLITNSALQVTSSNGVVGVNNNSVNTASTYNSSASTLVSLLQQNSMKPGQENSVNNANSPYGGTTMQIPSAGSSTSQLQVQVQFNNNSNSSSPFQSPTISTTSNSRQQDITTTAAMNSSANSLANISMQQPAQSNEADTNDTESSVQQIIQELMMSSQLNEGIGSLENDMKAINGMSQTGNAALNIGNCLIGNGITNNSSGIGGGVGFGNMGGGGGGQSTATGGQSTTAGGIRTALGSSSSNPVMNGRVGMISVPPQQQDNMRNRLLSGLGGVNGFNNLEFDWKSSP